MVCLILFFFVVNALVESLKCQFNWEGGLEKKEKISISNGKDRNRKEELLVFFHVFLNQLNQKDRE